MLDIVKNKIEQAFLSLSLDVPVVVTYSNRPDISDFQCNSLVKLPNKDEIAEKIVEILINDVYFSKVSYHVPGFINLSVTDSALIIDSPKKEITSQRIIIDYGGPNIAKPLHVGHLRSAVIGESLKRIAKSLGHVVISDIHLGDWGTPMGMMLAYMEMLDTQPQQLTVDYLNSLYPLAAQKFKTEEVFAARAKELTTELQNKEPFYTLVWLTFKNISKGYIKATLDKLGVYFDFWLGESDADEYIPKTLEILSGISEMSDGALIVPNGPIKSPLMLIKSDGAATYALTDLATLCQRERLQSNLIWYVVDARQSDHFKQVFDAAARSNLITTAQLEHLAFGTINGPDGKPFKTRDGGVMPLETLIDEAIDMARKEAGFAEITADNQQMLTEIAIGAIKFADLINQRTTDYNFNVGQIVKFTGKTGPYIQYAYVRCFSVIENSNGVFILPPKEFTHKAERDLALLIKKFNFVLETSFEKRMPHILCEYAYQLARAFSTFYTECDILHAETDVKNTRLFLTEKTKETLWKCLYCLGIPAPTKMERA